MTLCLKPLAAALTAALVLGVFAGPAAAEPVDLFAPPTPADVSGLDAAPADRLARRTAMTRLAAEAPAEAKSLRIKLFPGADAVFERKSKEAAHGGGAVWTGDAGPGERATLVETPRGLTGLVTIGDKSYRVDPVRGRTHRISEIATERMLKPGPLMPAPDAPSKRDAKAAPAPEPQGGGDKVVTIDVLFAYTPASKREPTDIIGEINLAAALANQAFAESDTYVRLRIADTMRVRGYDELPDRFEQSLNEMTAGVGPLAAVKKRRNVVKADLVVLFREQGAEAEYCGLAWYVENPLPSTAHRGYSVVGRECIAGHTTAHEIGHNMGLMHDRFVHDPAPPTDYNFGFVNLRKGVIDVMAYDAECVANTVFCKRVNLFSTPFELVKKQPFGVGAGNPDAAHAARRLWETRTCVADYR